MAAPPVVGVVGTGAMGMGVVRSLRRNGFATVARDIRDDAQAEAASLGARTTDSARALGDAVDVAIVLVVDAAQVEDVLFGAAGLAASASRPLVLVSSTVDPSFVAGLAPRLSAQGIALVDAPVSGGPAKAAAGTMTMMVSGPREARARCADVLPAIAARVFEVGDRAGDAATFKIVNNLLAAVNLAAGAEALAIARKAGLDVSRVVDVIGASSGASWIFEDRMRRALAGDYAPRAAARVLAKDVGIACDLAQRLAADAPFATAARRAFLDTLAAGYAEEDDAAIAKLFASRAGVLPPGH